MRAVCRRHGVRPYRLNDSYLRGDPGLRRRRVGSWRDSKKAGEYQEFRVRAVFIRPR
jgi:hypothetical protein